MKLLRVFSLRRRIFSAWWLVVPRTTEAIANVDAREAALVAGRWDKLLWLRARWRRQRAARGCVVECRGEGEAVVDKKKQKKRRPLSARRACVERTVDERSKPSACVDSGERVAELREDVRMISADDIFNGRVRSVMGLESEEESDERNEHVDAVFAEQRRLGWPGL